MINFTGKQKAVLHWAITLYKNECEKDYNRWKHIANRHGGKDDELLREQANSLAEHSKQEMYEAEVIIKTLAEN